MVIIRTELVEKTNLPEEFVRTNWTSAAARDMWQPVFQDCSNFFQDLEVGAVSAGLRKATIQTCATHKLVDATQSVIDSGLSLVVLDKIQMTEGYQSSGSPVDLSKPWQYKIAVTDCGETSRALLKAYKTNDNAGIGKLLGYPDCCVSFFCDYWVRDKWIDSSYPMAEGKTDHFLWSPYCNILLRWLGLRFVSHLPCSFNCQPTEDIGTQNFQLALNTGRRTQAEMLEGILAWPVEWSALHGIGLITTPVCRTEFRTDMWRQKAEIKLHSRKYPRAGARGLEFPFLKSCSDNGFSSEQAESRAHNLILDLSRSVNAKTVIDLGCGNMELLRKFREDFSCVTHGVDMDPLKSPDCVANIFDLESFPFNFDLCLISKARIKEEPIRWCKLLNIIEKQCKHLVIYSYNQDSDNVFTGRFQTVIGIKDAEYVAEFFSRVETTVRALRA